MKNVLIVSDRSNYFSFLGSQLEKNYNVFYIAVREEDKTILEQEGKEFIALEQLLENLSYKATEAILDEREIEKALFYDLQYDKFYNKSINHDLIIKRGIKYSIAIAKFIEANKISLVIVQNDLMGFASIPLRVARKKEIKTLIFEDGFFRPDTVVLDEKGVNFNNSCPRDRDFYEHLVIDQERFHNFLNEEKSKISKSKTKFPVSLGYILGLVRHPQRILTIYSGLKLYFQDYFYQRREIEDYVLLPLQVRTDSQILCHSSIKDMRDLVNICASALAKYNKRAKKQLALVVKEHPKDRCLIVLARSLKRPEVKVIFLSQADTRKLIEESSLVITINSTVGIESLLYYKPVITLGKAFYNIDGIAYHSDNFENLDTLIEKALSTPVNQDLINKFLYYLKFHYQVDGDLNHPDEKNILPVINRIKKVLES
ncbi:MAG: hypothetical protein WA977_08925 [Halobacteriota archaeon]